MIHSLRQVYTVCKRLKGWRTYYLTWVSKNGKGLNRLRWKWESVNPRDPSSTPAQQMSVTSETTVLTRRNSSWTIKYIKWAGFPVFFPFFILYCELPRPESQPWETPASPTCPSPGTWSRMALGVGQSSHTWAEGAMGTRRLCIQKGAQPGLPHCFSLRSRISVKLSDDQIAHIFGKTRSNTYSIKCHTTIVCERWKGLSSRSIQFLHFNDWEVRAEKKIVAQGHRAVRHQAIVPDCNFHPTDKPPLWARPSRGSLANRRKQHIWSLKTGRWTEAHLILPSLHPKLPFGLYTLAPWSGGGAPEQR